jgi:uncharacterized membrane protein
LPLLEALLAVILFFSSVLYIRFYPATGQDPG